MASTVAQAIHGGLLAGGVAVVRPAATALAWPLDTAGLEIVENPAAAEGIASSLRAGLAALEQPRTPPAGAALVILADQPLLRLPVLEALVSAWRAAPASIRPRYLAQPEAPGHPVLVDRGLWPRAASLAGDQGLGPLLAADPALRIIEVPGGNPDVDTPGDLRSLEEQY
ncbi:MAG: NTP transferase domain-containing protein [Gemmatimonadetes bacterium]|nr:NTP transferase domain-containing protein [Gemmatimonadota bacterium]